MESNLYFNGLPTGPAVKKLEEKWPDVESLRGTMLSHADLEALIGEKRTASRYRTVMSAWRRKLLNESGIVLTGRGAGGEGYRVLSDNDQVSFSVSEERGVGRKLRMCHVAVANVNPEKLSPEKLKIREYMMISMGRIQAAMLHRKAAVQISS